MRAKTTLVLVLASLTFAACSIQSHADRSEVTDAPIGHDAPTEVELTLVLVDPAGRDVTAEAVLDQPPKKLWVWREGDTIGSESREAKIGVPIRVSTHAEPRRIVQLAPEATDHWLRHGWGIAGDPAPALVLEPDAVGARSLALQVAPMRRIRFTWKLPEDVADSSDLHAHGYLAPVSGQCRSFDFQRQVEVPVGKYELWACARAGAWPYVEMWAHETIHVLDRPDPQSFAANFKHGVEIEGRFVDRKAGVVAAWVDPITRSGGSPLIEFAPTGIASRSFGPPFNRVTFTCGFWSVSPGLDGGFKLAGLPPVTEISLLSTGTNPPPKFWTPQQNGHVGDIFVRGK